MLYPGNLGAPVGDMKQSRAWYANAFDFETVYLHSDPVEGPEGNYAALRRDGAEVHSILDEPPRDHSWMAAVTGYLLANKHRKRRSRCKSWTV
jgi:hypothetical protein